DFVRKFYGEDTKRPVWWRRSFPLGQRPMANGRKCAGGNKKRQTGVRAFWRETPRKIPPPAHQKRKRQAPVAADQAHRPILGSELRVASGTVRRPRKKHRNKKKRC